MNNPVVFALAKGGKHFLGKLKAIIGPDRAILLLHITLSTSFISTN
jgi:hypothetical protein